ncbi:MAG: hypothetical protein RBS86_04920 [Candidatus Moranbacteria bacterium]|jgi:hypothetical protein|nr:hypothetical protein [Candidatus Moranbacteria bacterium]
MEYISLFIKLGFFIIFLLFVVRWFLVIPYLWFMYDRHIIKIRKDLDIFRKKERQEPLAQSVIDGRIKIKERDLSEKLDILEAKRRLFLDRINLFISLSSINRKD